MSETQANTAQYENFIPPAVRRQAERAEAIARGIGMRNAGEGEALAPTVVERLPGADPNASMVVPESEIREQLPPATQTPPATQSPPPPPTQSPTPPPTQAPTPPPATVVAGDIQAQLHQLQQRFNTLQGKYSAELPPLHAQLRDLRADNERLNTELATATLELANRAPGNSGTVPQEDLDAYGEDLVTKTRGWARAELSPEIQRLEQKLTDIQKTTTTASKGLTFNNVVSTLDVLVPQWKTIDTAPGFLEWLNQVDPMAGQVRMNMFVGARDDGDGARCATFYQRYSAEHTAPPPGTETQQGQTPPRAPTLPLEALAAPGIVRPTGTGAPPEVREFTRAQINAFYTAAAKGKFADNPRGYAQTEADIQAAMRAGRIR